MNGEIHLATILKNLRPVLSDESYIFHSAQGSYGDYEHLKPIATFSEAQGLSLVIPSVEANKHRIPFESTFKRITLNVHSSLHAVGLTAAVATQLTSRGISANVVAAYYHDHIFVPTAQAETALATLLALCEHSG